MFRCIMLALSGVNWELMYEELKYWKMKWQMRKFLK